MRFMLRVFMLRVLPIIVGIIILPLYVSLYLPTPDNFGLSIAEFMLGGVMAIYGLIAALSIPMR